ncbi:ABC transporter substrate-binding protein [Sulfurimonas sp.]
MRHTIVLLLLLILFSSCSKEDSLKELKISTNAWIGYAPLYYANEMGDLKKLNIKLMTNVSLAEAANLFDIGQADMVTTTQHEYHALKVDYPDIVPTILIDRSNGGDMILSNQSIKELQNAKSITAYLEINSINADLLKDFLRNNNINKEKINFINNDQSQIAHLSYTKHPTIIVTYTPYDTLLEKQGFTEVASTQNIDSLIVIDALCIEKKLLIQERTRLQKLKKVLDRAIVNIQNNPKESHKLISKYLDEMSYSEFQNSLQTIEWINYPSKQLLKHISSLGYDEKYIIK